MRATARDVARGVLRRVEQGDAYASLALAGELDKSGLATADRALATELVYGVLRHRARLDRALAALASRGISRLPEPVVVALRAAAYQLLFLRVPAHAAVDDAVSAVREVAGERLAGFANAILRRLAVEGEPPPPPATDPYATLEAVYSMPRWLAAHLLAALPREEVVPCAEALNRPARVALRVALGRRTREEVAARIREARPDAEVDPAPFLAEALWVRGGGPPETLDAFQEGLVTVQDPAAQLVGRMCGAAPGMRILDACAGVGGKATHLAQLAEAGGGPAAIDAADLSRTKLDLAEDAARRMGVGGIRFLVCDLTAPASPDLAPAYDRILIDAPCSGLGVLRRHPEAKWRRRAGDVTRSAALQARLLAALAPRVAPGGSLVYSVCTFTSEEGPAQVERFLAAHADFALEPPPPTIGVDWAPFLDEGGRFRSWPHRHDLDAFFAARLVRRR